LRSLVSIRLSFESNVGKEFAVGNSVDIWEHFFKPEVRSSGRRYFKEGSVNVSQPSDTEIVAYIRGSTPVKISLKSPSVESSFVSANCSCPLSKKGQFCKHIWGTLLTVQEKKPDFLEGKTEITKQEVEATNDSADSKLKQKTTFKSSFKKPMSEEQVQKQESYKAKQADYRKAQYQKQKERLKAKKQTGKSKTLQTEFPEHVESALTYFSENGFALAEPFQVEAVQLAKKKLSRIFHPDIGGSHEEIVQLNTHAANLIAYIESK
jgi:uncharacterized Zn finger protein